MNNGAVGCEWREVETPFFQQPAKTRTKIYWVLYTYRWINLILKFNKI
jgi:hypothetical protein